VDDEGIKVGAKASLSRALKEKFYVEGHERPGGLFVTNERGLTYGRYPANLEAVTRKLEFAQRGLAEKDDLVRELRARIFSLEAHLGGMTQSLDFYKAGRERFLSVFKRDKLGTNTAVDRRIIDKGNDVVHGGDIVTDAFIYLPNPKVYGNLGAKIL